MAVRKKAARASTWARIRVNASFNGMVIGDEAQTELDERVKGWVRAGLVTVMHVWTSEDPDGPSEAGPSVAEPDDAGGEPSGG